jgi:acetyl esterase
MKKGKKILLVIGILFFVGLLCVNLSPWPSTLFYRFIFNKGGVAMNKALENKVPNTIITFSNLSYDTNDEDAIMDIYYPDSVAISEKLPVIIWTHGGGAISGSKDQVANYCKILSAENFVVIAINYSIAPEAKYPKPVIQLISAIDNLVAIKNEHPIDTEKIFLAGDSAGSHITSQAANCITNPNYAKLMNIEPKTSPENIKGLVLFCGPYNMYPDEKDIGHFMKTVLWAYSGHKKYNTNKHFHTANILDFLDSNFPPSFISVGNADPLESHSLELAKKLQDLNVKKQTLFFSKNHQPKLNHEYQFDLDKKEGQFAFNEMIRFIKIYSN